MIVGERVDVEKDDFDGDEFSMCMESSFLCSKCQIASPISIRPYAADGFVSLNEGYEKLGLTPSIIAQHGMAKCDANGMYSVIGLHPITKILCCTTCGHSHIIVAGCGEFQPSRFRCRISGVWRISSA